MLTVFLSPRRFTPNEIGNIQVLPWNVLCMPILYIDTLTSPCMARPQWVPMLPSFADKAQFKTPLHSFFGPTVKIHIFPGSTAGLFLTWKPLEPLTTHPFCSSSFTLGFQGCHLSYHLIEISGHEDK